MPTQRAANQRPTRSPHCPTDDTICIAQQFASDLCFGVSRGVPGEAAGGPEQHHGTPNERRDALLTGDEAEDPSVCSGYAAG